MTKIEIYYDARCKHCAYLLKLTRTRKSWCKKHERNTTLKSYCKDFKL